MRIMPWGLILIVIGLGFAPACLAQKAPDAEVREPVVAGKFYSDSPPRLKLAIEKFLIEISVLTPLRPVSGAGDIVVGRDGVLLSKDDHTAVFLPQVASEQGWKREELLDNLCLKADLSMGCWKQHERLSTFQAVVFSESEFK
jgi:hypothetical protein